MLPDRDRLLRIRRRLALAVNHEMPQLDRVQRELDTLPVEYISDTPIQGDYPVVATVATDGGEGRLSLAPISIQIVRVADNRGTIHFEEFVPMSLHPEEIMKYFFASDDRFQRFLQYIGIAQKELLPETEYQRSHLLSMLRELLEWAALLKLAAQKKPMLLLRDGLLRSVMLRDCVFQALRSRFVQLTDENGHLLVGVAKRSSVVNYLTVAFNLKDTFSDACPAYLTIPSRLEKDAAPSQYRWIGCRAMGQLFLARLDHGLDVPVLPVDIASWQLDRLEDVMSCLYRSSRGSFPNRGYPQELIMAHERAKLSSLDIEMLEVELRREVAQRNPVLAHQVSALLLQGCRIAEEIDE